MIDYSHERSPCYVVFTWNHARIVEPVGGCTRGEWRDEVARKAGVSPASVLRITRCEWRSVAWAIVEEWNTSHPSFRRSLAAAESGS
jgi:hypothetical protein